MKRIFLIIFIIILLSNGIFAYDKIGLVLSGGAARGLAHIGVLKAFEQYDIPIDVVGGTSIGAIVGALWSAGYTASEIESLFVNNNITDWFLSEPILKRKPIHFLFNNYSILFSLDVKRGAINIPEATMNDRVINYEIKSYLTNANYAIQGDFNKLYKPFLCVATDVRNDSMIVFRKGDLSTAVRASMAIPILFKPVIYKNSYLFDGGMHDNLPITIVRDSFNTDMLIIVSVFKKHDFSKTQDLNLFKIGFSLIDMLLKQMPPDSAKNYGILIQPRLDNIYGYEYNKAQEIINIGYQSAMEKMPEILEKIKRREEYPPGEIRKEHIANFANFEEFEIDSVIIENDNNAQQIITSNALGFKKNEKFSYRKLGDSFYKLYALDMFEQLDFAIQPDTINKTLNLKIKEKIRDMNKLGIGGFYSNTAGMNIHLKLEKSNLFNKGLLFDIYTFLGVYNKGVRISLNSPPLIFNRFISTIDYNYFIKKYYAVYNYSFDYFKEQYLTILSGHSYDQYSLTSVISGYRHKDYFTGNFRKYFAGIYHIQNRLDLNDNRPEGYRINFLGLINMPQNENNDLPLFKSSYHNYYLKFILDYKSYIKLGNKFDFGLSGGAGRMLIFRDSMNLPEEVLTDYFMISPTTTSRFEFDRNLLFTNYANLGIDFRYNLNKVFFLQYKNNFFIVDTINSYNNYSVYSGNEIALVFKNLLGVLRISYELFYTENYSKQALNVFWGTQFDKIDIFNKI